MGTHHIVSFEYVLGRPQLPQKLIVRKILNLTVFVDEMWAWTFKECKRGELNISGNSINSSEIEGMRFGSLKLLRNKCSAKTIWKDQTMLPCINNPSKSHKTIWKSIRWHLYIIYTQVILTFQKVPTMKNDKTIKTKCPMTVLWVKKPTWYKERTWLSDNCYIFMSRVIEFVVPSFTPLPILTRLLRYWVEIRR